MCLCRWRVAEATRSTAVKILNWPQIILNFKYSSDLKDVDTKEQRNSPPPSSLCVSWWSLGRRWASLKQPTRRSWWAWVRVQGRGWSSATVDEKSETTRSILNQRTCAKKAAAQGRSQEQPWRIGMKTRISNVWQFNILRQIFFTVYLSVMQVITRAEVHRVQ